MLNINNTSKKERVFLKIKTIVNEIYLTSWPESYRSDLHFLLIITLNATIIELKKNKKANSCPFKKKIDYHIEPPPQISPDTVEQLTGILIWFTNYYHIHIPNYPMMFFLQPIHPKIVYHNIRLCYGLHLWFHLGSYL